MRSEQAFRLGFADSTDIRKKKWQLRASMRDHTVVKAFVDSLPRLNRLLAQPKRDWASQ